MPEYRVKRSKLTEDLPEIIEGGDSCWQLVFKSFKPLLLLVEHCATRGELPLVAFETLVDVDEPSLEKLDCLRILLLCWLILAKRVDLPMR